MTWSCSSPIIGLPEEILHMIFTEAVKSERLSDENHDLALSRTCKRFHHTICPIIYRDIDFVWPDSLVPPTFRAHRFLNTMERSPDLARLCRRLAFTIDENRCRGPEEFIPLNRLLSRLTGLQSLCVWNGAYLMATWMTVFKTLAQCKSLTHFQICDNVNLHEPLPYHIWRLWSAYTNNFGDHYLNMLGEKCIRLKNDDIKSGLRTLEINGVNQTPEIICELLSWPMSLEKFSFHGLYHHLSMLFRWNFEILDAFLNQHRFTLTSIRIGPLPIGRPLIRLSEYPNLQHLHLSAYNLTATDPKTAARSLLATRLSSLTIDFSLDSWRSVHWGAFQRWHVDWIGFFANWAFLHKYSPAFRLIHIKFSPDLLYTRDHLLMLDPELKEKVVYPWDLMDELGEKLRRFGIEVSYDEPTFDRAFFDYYTKEESPCLPLCDCDDRIYDDHEAHDDEDHGADGDYEYGPDDSHQHEAGDGYDEADGNYEDGPGDGHQYEAYDDEDYEADDDQDYEIDG